MGMFDALNINVTGLKAQRLRLDVIANNIANVSTTRTVQGTAFKRSQVVLRPRDPSYTFRSHFLPEALKKYRGQGVEVTKIEKDLSPGRLRYEPNHPDAIDFGEKAGYVEYPNVNVVEEMTDMISASRSYEANVTLMNTAKKMFVKALDIGV